MAFFAVAILTIGDRAAFAEFERQAAQILAGHGAVIETTVTLDQPSPTGQPRELHVVRFPGRDAFARYRSDPSLAALAALRQRAIVETQILTGEAGPAY